MHTPHFDGARFRRFPLERLKHSGYLPDGFKCPVDVPLELVDEILRDAVTPEVDQVVRLVVVRQVRLVEREARMPAELDVP